MSSKSILSYKGFAETSFDLLFTAKEKEGMQVLTANYFSSGLIKNQGNGKFEIIPLPALAQLAPVFAILTGDFNHDSNPDLILCGNDFGSEVFNGRLDAFNGLCLQGNGKGEFIPLNIEESGLYIPGNAHAMTIVKTKQSGKLVVAAQRRGVLKVFGVK